MSELSVHIADLIAPFILFIFEPSSILPLQVYLAFICHFFLDWHNIAPTKHRMHHELVVYNNFLCPLPPTNSTNFGFRVVIVVGLHLFLLFPAN